MNKLFSALRKRLGFSDLNFRISPEIVNDKLSSTIASLAKQDDVKKIIEIGSSSGAGSTRSFIEAIAGRPDANEVHLYCLELSNKRYNALKRYTAQFPFVKCFNLSSVAANEFPSEEEVTNFYRTRNTKLNNVSLQEVLRWRTQDLEYITQSGKDVNGINAIKETYGIENFDLCLIDGSEFTGSAELSHLLGAKYILLDDTESYKCREAFESLASNTDYQLVKHDPFLRNGFAFFKLKQI